MSDTVVNKKAPAVGTDFDLLGGKDSQAEYYKLKLEEMRIKNAEGTLTSGETQALKQMSDLDVLTVKILAKLKVLSDYDPELNTMRALTGHDDRSDIARELATRHYNKAVTDHFVSKFVNVDKTNQLLGFTAGGGGLAAKRSGLNNELGEANKSWAVLGSVVRTATGGAAPV